MPNMKSETGNKYGKWTVLEYAGLNKRNAALLLPRLKEYKESDFGEKEKPMPF